MPLFSHPPAAEHLIVGLGNPGEDFARSRHNVGFRCLTILAQRYRLGFKEKRSHARLACGPVAGRAVVLARPYTFMNRSGTAVAPLLRWLGLPVERLLVIYDDLDLPPGTIRLRGQGGAAGHRGMLSMIAALGAEDFPRLRIGIGRPADPRMDPMDFVLQPLTAAEEEDLAPTLERAADAVECYLREGLAVAMDRFNRAPQGSEDGYTDPDP